MEKESKSLRMVVHTLFLLFADAEDNAFESGKKVKMAIKKALAMVFPDNGREEYNGVMRSIRTQWEEEFMEGFNCD